MKYSIIIPMYGYLKGVEAILWDIHDACISHEGEYEIILMDDNSPLDNAFVQGKVDWWRKNVFTKETFHYHRNRLNHGFGVNCNIGFENSSGEYVFFISSDVKVHRDFIASSNMIFGLLDDVKKVVGGKLLNYDTGWNKFGDKLFPYLEGWMLGFKAVDFEELGGFDPIFGKYDYEDIDICTKALSLGYVLEPLKAGHFDHYSGRSIAPIFGSARVEKTNTNKEVFRRKWNA